MKGLLLKDLLELRLKMKAGFIFLIFYGVLTVLYFKSLTSFVVIMSMYSITFPLSAIALDERSRWNLYILAAPLRRRDYVLSKYALSLLNILAAFAVEVLISLIFGRPELAELRPFMLVMLGATLTFSAIMLPFAMWLGTERARYIMLGIFILPTALIMYIANAGALPSSPFDEADLAAFLSAAVPAFGALLFAVSCPIACALYSRREL